MTPADRPAIRGVIFDLDGTLADSLRDIANGVNHALDAVGLPTHPVAPFAHWVGDGLPMLCRRAMNGDRLERLDEVVRLASAHYRSHFLDHTTLYPGIEGLLTALRQRGVPMAVLSNKPHEFTAAMVDRLCNPSTFASVEGCRDESERKPDPQVALCIAAAFGVPPSQVAFVGDSAVDMHTAHNAGMLAIGVAWGFRGVDELQGAGADHIAMNVDELARLLVD